MTDIYFDLNKLLIYKISIVINNLNENEFLGWPKTSILMKMVDSTNSYDINLNYETNMA